MNDDERRKRLEWAQTVKTVSIQARLHIEDLAAVTAWMERSGYPATRKGDIVSTAFELFTKMLVQKGLTEMPHSTQSALDFIRARLDIGHPTKQQAQALSAKLFAEDGPTYETTDGVQPVQSTQPTTQTHTSIVDDPIPQLITTAMSLREVDKIYAQGGLTAAKRDELINNILDDAPVEDLTPTQIVERQARIDARQKQQMKDAMQEKKDT